MKLDKTSNFLDQFHLLEWNVGRTQALKNYFVYFNSWMAMVGMVGPHAAHTTDLVVAHHYQLVRRHASKHQNEFAEFISHDNQRLYSGRRTLEGLQVRVSLEDLGANFYDPEGVGRVRADRENIMRYDGTSVDAAKKHFMAIVHGSEAWTQAEQKDFATFALRICAEKFARAEASTVMPDFLLEQL